MQVRVNGNPFVGAYWVERFTGVLWKKVTPSFCVHGDALEARGRYAAGERWLFV